MKKTTMRLAIMTLSLFMMAQTVSAADLLIPVGQVIGLEISENQVTIAGFDAALGEGAKAAGLQEGDRIAAIDGKSIHTAEDVRQALLASDGDVDMIIVRDAQEKELELEPAITRDGPKLGVFLRQGITGVGTVTFMIPRPVSLGHWDMVSMINTATWWP